jgi:hypothetical protein
MQVSLIDDKHQSMVRSEQKCQGLMVVRWLRGLEVAIQVDQQCDPDLQGQFHQSYKFIENKLFSTQKATKT